MASAPMAHRAFSIARRKFTAQVCCGTNLLNARPGCTLVGSSPGKFTEQVHRDHKPARSSDPRYHSFVRLHD